VKNPTLSASVIAPSCLTAGLLATSACIQDPDEAIQAAERLMDTELILQTETRTLLSFRAHQHILGN